MKAGGKLVGIQALTARRWRHPGERRSGGQHAEQNHSSCLELTAAVLGAMTGEQQHFGAGALILQEGDEADCAYLIERGRVEVLRHGSQGPLVLAVLGAGELVGEMGIISEKPRSASVRAVEATTVRRIGREELLSTLQTDRTAAIALLKALFERLRQADARLAQQQLGDEQPPKRPPQAARLVALTPEAQRALGREVMSINSVPFRIGRRDDDPLRCNDLELNDAQPFRVSRHHLLIDNEQGRLVVYDRGSRLGSWVNGQPLGGLSSFSGPVLLGETPLELVLGPADSPLRFRLEPAQS